MYRPYTHTQTHVESQRFFFYITKRDAYQIDFFDLILFLKYIHLPFCIIRFFFSIGFRLIVGEDGRLLCKSGKKRGGDWRQIFSACPFLFSGFYKGGNERGKKKFSFIVRKNPLLFNVCNRRKTIGRHINMYTHMKREVLNFFLCSSLKFFLFISSEKWKVAYCVHPRACGCHSPIPSCWFYGDM